jgi:hypothetical protein
MTSQTLLIILGAALSLLLSYIPGLATWFQPLPDDKKRFIMLIMLVVITGAIFGLSCVGWMDAVTCDKPGAIGLITAFLLALMANQSTFAISPKIGLNKPIAKNIILTTETGKTTEVAMTQLGTTTPPVEPPK